MGVERKYYCDLCRDKFDVDELRGIHFEYGGFVEADARRVERHLCMVCLRSAATLMAKIEAREVPECE